MATLFRTIARHGITLPADQIADLCRQLDVLELAVFGSFLRDDFGPESDIDLLVLFKNDDLGPWMGKLQRLETRLSALLGREVDAVSKRDVEASENWIRRDHILGTAQVIYESRPGIHPRHRPCLPQAHWLRRGRSRADLDEDLMLQLLRSRRTGGSGDHCLNQLGQEQLFAGTGRACGREKEEACTRKAGADHGFSASRCGLS